MEENYDQLLYDAILEEYDANYYVYVVESCFGMDVYYQTPNLKPCKFCKEMPEIILEGYVKDLVSKERENNPKCYYEKQIKELVENKLNISYSFFKNLTLEEQEELLSTLKKICDENLENNQIKVLTNIKDLKRKYKSIEYMKKGD